MTLSTQLQEYVDFLGWFEKKHPLLNKKYWPYITIPEKGAGVRVYRACLEQAVYDRLLQVEEEYYDEKCK